MKLRNLLTLLLFITVYQGFSQKSQVQIARNSVGRLQVAIANGKEKKDQLAVIGEGIKASEAAGSDKRTKNWPETWAINAYLNSYVAIIEENPSNADLYFNKAQESLATAIKLDRFQDNSKFIDATKFNLIIKKQDIGNKAFKDNDFTAAFNALKDVSDYFPKDTALALNAGLAALNSKALDNAEQYFKRAKENGVRNPLVFQSLANIYVSKFNTEQAIKSLEEGIKINAFNEFLTNDYINLLLDNERYPEAAAAIESTLKIDNKNKLLYFLYGYLKQIEGNNSNAEFAYKKAIGLDQNYFDALYQLGITYISLANSIGQKRQPGGQPDYLAYLNRAEFTLQQAYEINPNDRPTVQLLTDIYTKKNKPEKVQELKKKLEEF
jgi:tetratricopeptide (TPR) repeat protein